MATTAGSTGDEDGDAEGETEGVGDAAAEVDELAWLVPLASLQPACLIPLPGADGGAAALRTAGVDVEVGIQTDRTAQVIIAGHAFVQNLRLGHYELGLDAPPATLLAAAFTELARAI